MSKTAVSCRPATRGRPGKCLHHSYEQSADNLQSFIVPSARQDSAPGFLVQVLGMTTNWQGRRVRSRRSGMSTYAALTLVSGSVKRRREPDATLQELNQRNVTDGGRVLFQVPLSILADISITSPAYKFSAEHDGKCGTGVTTGPHDRAVVGAARLRLRGTDEGVRPHTSCSFTCISFSLDLLAWYRPQTLFIQWNGGLCSEYQFHFRPKQSTGGNTSACGPCGTDAGVRLAGCGKDDADAYPGYQQRRTRHAKTGGRCQDCH